LDHLPVGPAAPSVGVVPQDPVVQEIDVRVTRVPGRVDGQRVDRVGRGRGGSVSGENGEGERGQRQRGTPVEATSNLAGGREGRKASTVNSQQSTVPAP